MLEKIQDRFSESIQIQIAAADLLPQTLAFATQKISDCLLRGNKIIVCGYGRSLINAQLLVSHLLHRYELARPSLPAIWLNAEGVIGSFAVQHNDLAQLYRKQYQAVAKSGDLLVVFSPIGDEEPLLNVIHGANNDQLEIIAFTSSKNDHIQNLLDENDLEISMPSSSEMRIIEGHLFCVNLLCELIDHQLFSHQN